jgi:hypothetical protein
MTGNTARGLELDDEVHQHIDKVHSRNIPSEELELLRKDEAGKKLFIDCFGETVESYQSRRTQDEETVWYLVRQAMKLNPGDWGSRNAKRHFNTGYRISLD